MAMMETDGWTLTDKSMNSGNKDTWLPGTRLGCCSLLSYNRRDLHHFISSTHTWIFLTRKLSSRVNISVCVLSIHDGIAFGNICLAGSPTPRESPGWVVIILTSHLEELSSILVWCRHRQKGIWRNISVILMINIIHLRSERRNSLMFQRRQWHYIRVSGTCQLVSLSNYQSLSK